MLLIGLQLLLLVLSGAADCLSEGCTASVGPVCGSDGLTYMNECLASCQDVVVASIGSCAAEHAAIAAVHIPAGLFAQEATEDIVAPSAARILPAAAISAHHSEGLRMVGVLKRSSFHPTMPVLDEDSAPHISSGTSHPGTIVMVNSQGHLYAAPPGSKLHGPAAAAVQAHQGSAWAPLEPLNPSEATAPLNEDVDGDGAVAGHEAEGVVDATATGGFSSSSSSAGLEQEQLPAAAGGSRKLQGIFGLDTRRELRTTPKYPFSAAGHLMFTNPESTQRYQCSGTLVGTYAVLTAAHCVVARSGAVQQDIQFTAAETSRNHAGLGVASGLRVYFNSGYLGTGPEWTSWDLGIVILDKPLGVNSSEAFQQEVMHQHRASVAARRSRANRRPKPERLEARQELVSPPGTVGYAATPQLSNTLLMSTGYPGDKPLGSAWTLECSLTDTKPSSNIVLNKCPIVNGQSGSSLIERRVVDDQAHHYVRGIVSFEMCKKTCNGVCCDGQAAYNGVLKITPFFQRFIDEHRGMKA